MEPAGGIGDPTNREGRMSVEARGLVLAGLLAALAGMVDVIGYLHLSGLFVSFMSGNSTQLAAALGQGELGAAGAITKLVMLFVLGAAAGPRDPHPQVDRPPASRVNRPRALLMASQDIALWVPAGSNSTGEPRCCGTSLCGAGIVCVRKLLLRRQKSASIELLLR